MKAFIVLSALVAVAVASPGYLASAVVPYGYHAGAPLGHDGRVVDTPEVAHAKAAHLTAHAAEASRTAGYAHAAHAYVAPALAYAAPAHVYASPAVYGYASPAAYAAPAAYGYGYHSAAPIGHDGRVVDTPEVAHAKAAHLAAHAQEAAKTAGYGYGAHAYAPVAYGYAHGAPIGHDGRVVDTPEVAHAKAAHFAAHAEAASRAHGAHYW